MLNVYARLDLPSALGCSGHPPGTVRLFVGNGISRGSSTWATYYDKPGGSLARLKRVALPLRRTRAAAEADLLDYAKRMKYGIEYSE